jgi:hypothetical protein
MVALDEEKEMVIVLVVFLYLIVSNMLQFPT